MTQKFRPILMSPPMVRATYEALQKTETRRLSGLDQVNEKPDDWKFSHFEGPDKLGRTVAVFNDGPFIVRVPCPYGAPGDVLWIRENWAVGKGYDGMKTGEVCNLLQNEYVIRWFESDGWDKVNTGKVRPSIHMPRKIARYYLDLNRVRVERLQSITQESALLEGTGFAPHRPSSTDCVKWVDNNLRRDCCVCAFKLTWMRLNGLTGMTWDFNPWTWVLSFKPKV